MPIGEAFAQTEHQPDVYDFVHVKYYDEELLDLDIVISFPDHGFHLKLDPWSQRFQMRYSTSLMGGPSSLATFSAVYSLFGPTFPGNHDKTCCSLQGLSFVFPIPSKNADCCNDQEADLSLKFPDGATPVACRVSVYDPSTNRKVGFGSSMVKACLPPLAAGSFYMEEVQVKLGEELWFTVAGQLIHFGASAQVVRNGYIETVNIFLVMMIHRLFPSCSLIEL